MVFIKHFLILLLSFSLLPAAFAQKNRKKSKEAEEKISFAKADLDKDRLQQAEYLFSEGMKHFLLEDYKKALVLFKESQEIYPSNPSIPYKIAHAHFFLEDYDAALKSVDEALAISDDNEYFYLLKADIFEKQKRYKEVAFIYEKMLRDFPPNEHYFFNLASAYLKESELSKAIDTYNRAEEFMGISESLIRYKQRIFLNLKDLDGALYEGQKLVDAFPSASQYKLSQAALLLSLKRKPEALSLIRLVMEEEPLNPQAKLIMAKVYLADGEIAKADTLMTDAFQSTEMDPEEKIEVLRYYLANARGSDSEGIDKATRFTALALEAHPDSPALNALYAELLSLTQDFGQARERYLQSLEENSDNYELWLKVIDLEWKMGDFQKVVKTAEKAQELFPNQAELYLFQGSAHYVLKEYESALAVLEMGKMYALEEQLQKEFNSQLGDVYYYLGDYELSDASYSEVLKVDPNNISVLNNYAYFLALRKDDLEKAIVMGEKLMELAPNQPNYMDTYGWVLFQAKKYKEAKKYLEKAAANSNSGTILEHYGDVLFKLGEKESALEQWNKAKEAGGVDNLKMLEEKIQAGKIIE